MVSAMQRPRCVWHIYQNLQVFLTRGGWVEVETFGFFVLFEGRRKVFCQLTAATEAVQQKSHSQAKLLLPAL